MRVGVIGGGAWGTALAIHMARMGNATTLWVREPEVVAAINEQRENPAFLPGQELPPGIEATGDIVAAIGSAELLLTSVPAPYLEASLQPASGAFRDDQIVVSCTKGIDTESLDLPVSVIERLAPSLSGHVVALSGPSFAAEVARGEPTAVTVASQDPGRAGAAQSAISSDRLRCYTSDDPAGVQLGGALKNVYAIASGIALGLGYGANARAALIARGLSELAEIGVRLGARRETFMGLSGLGDLVLTCTSEQSRNFKLGTRLGRGDELSTVLGEARSHAEGVPTCRAARKLSQRLEIDAPIVATLHDVLFDAGDARAAGDALMQRPARPELS